MSAKAAIPEEGHYVVGVFHDADAFVKTLGALLRADFDRAAISILADHGAVRDHFGRIPDPAEMADRADTPREDLDTEGALHKAIRFIAETAAIIGEIGAAGAALAVGGPIGAATAAATTTDASVGDVFSRYVDGRYRSRFEASVRDGGVVCWVHVRNPKERDAAAARLSSGGGKDVHEVDL